MNDFPPVGGRHEAERERSLTHYARRVVADLSAQTEAMPHDLGERLRFARETALARAHAARAAAPQPSVVRVAGSQHAGALALGGGPRAGSPWWVRLSGLLPLLALLAGLALIQNQHARAQIAAVAEIDSDLLVDELPPSAYSDPGFVQFLKTAHH